ncbi:MAG: hypothetical protein ACXVP1_09245 [Thermoleophilia bacterium]
MTETLSILAAVAWAITLVLIAVAVRASWGVAKHLPQWLVTVILLAVGVLVLLAFVVNTAWLGIAALVTVFAVWIWFLARWLFPRVPEVHERFERARDPQLAAEQDADRAESAERGAALEHVLDEVVHEEHPEDIKAIEGD